MTPATLEKFHQASIHLQVLGRQRKKEEYYREVILRLDRIGQACGILEPSKSISIF